MATRYSKAETITGVIQSGYESSSPNATESIPSCGIEDVDRAFFELFSEKLPLYYKVSKDTGEQRRVPVVFASGERFAVLSKSSPLRDKNGALILPLISITRNGLEFESTKGMIMSDRYPETTIKKKLSIEDQEYQNIINSSKLSNAKYSSGTAESKNWLETTGRLLGPKLDKNIYEITVIPTPKYFTAKFEVTIWCQYVQQLNAILETLLGAYLQPGGRTIRIDTKKGYWFVAYFDQSISQDNNFGDYTDSERLIKATLTAEVPAYLILPKHDGIPNGTKRYFSAPNVTFETYLNYREKEKITAKINVGDSTAYILNDIETIESETIGRSVGENVVERSLNNVNNLLSGIEEMEDTSLIGNTVKIKNNNRTLNLDFDPLTGEKKDITVRIVDSNPTRGEEVYLITFNNRQKS